MTDHDDEFEDFTAALGKLMVRGLNQLPTEAKEMVSETVGAGGEVFVICRTDPPSLAGMLSDGKTNYELFRVTEQMH
jgi:hypothetical protein